MSKKLRAGLVGLGQIGRNHARVLQSLEGVELVGAADSRGDIFNAVADAPVFGSVDELVEAEIDYCVVAVPTVAHAEVALKLAAAGIHAMVEKPLAATSAEAEAMCIAFEEADLIGAVGHIERFNASLQNMRERLDDGIVGEIFQISTRRQSPFPPRINDVGVVADLASHDIDLSAWIVGSTYASISARTAHKSGREHEDLVAAVGVLTNGVITQHTVNWLSPMKERRTVVLGEGGMLIADTLSADLTFYKNGTVMSEWDALAVFRGVSEGDVTRFAIAKPEPLLVEHQAMRDAVLGVGDDIVTMRQGLQTVRVIEATLESSRTGNSVSGLS